MAISLGVRKGLAPKTASRLRRQARGRKKIFGAPDRPRMVVTRSARHIGVQIIDDVQGRTLASASSMEAGLRTATGDKSAKAAGIENVVFDRAGNKYTGRIASLADAAREAGLGF